MQQHSLSRDQVRAYDKFAINQVGVPSVVLMENAGRGATDVLRSLGITGRVVIGCGKGNNGGDGLVIARHLVNNGHDVLILLFASPDELSGDARIQWNIVQNMAISTQVYADTMIDENALAATFADADWIVDALFGTGLTGPLRSPFERIVNAINVAAKRVLAIDLPSGLDCDSGMPLGTTVRAAHTVTFVAPKRGFANPESVAFTGTVHVVDIGIVM